jgi:hypothetical protein
MTKHAAFLCEGIGKGSGFYEMQDQRPRSSTTRGIYFKIFSCRRAYACLKLVLTALGETVREKGPTS